MKGPQDWNDQERKKCDMGIRVMLQRTRKGYVIRSYDFTSNVYDPFEGEGSLKLAMQYAESKDYKVLTPPFVVSGIPEQDEPEGKKT